MATVSANFTVPANTANGGRLQGGGFNTTPRMNGGDTLQIVVTWAGSNPPHHLTGYFVISPVQSASNQIAPSPFKDGSNYLCYKSLRADKGTGQQYTFSTSSFTIPTGAPAGQYELTLVVEDGSVQWSEDPEFDTTGN
jgi:hypothetical protein